MSGLNTLLLGGSGEGKTYSLRTLVEAGLEVFVLYTEPPGTVLADLPKDKYHFHYVKPSAPSWSAMAESAKKINTLSFKTLSGMEGINKHEYAQFIEVISTLGNFKCDCCGKEFGDVSTWDDTRALVVDSLSGLNIMAMDLVVGSKPMKSIADWGVAMDNLSRLISKLTTDTMCHFVLIAHLEPERDEVTGRIENVPSALGRKLGPTIPRFFDNVIHCVRVGTKFEWSTASPNVALKARDVQIAEHLPPTFVPLIQKWKSVNSSRS